MRVAATLVAAIAALVATTVASAHVLPSDPPREMTWIAQDDCGPQNPYATSSSGSVCAYVTGRITRFSGPGVLRARWADLTDYDTLDGQRIGPYSSAIGTNAAYDDQVRARWDIKGLGTNASGVMNFTMEDAGGRALSVGVTANLKHFDSETADGLSLTCQSETYIACTTPTVWRKNRDSFWTKNPPTYVIGFASLETRPLIIKVLNLTEQPLVLRGDADGDGVLRQVGVYAGVGAYATVPAAADGTTGVAYYQYLRDVSRANSVNLAFTFADGVGTTAYTGGLVDASIRVAEDGDTDASKCTAPTGSLVNIECSVTMMGDHNGILTAVVAVTD